MRPARAVACALIAATALFGAAGCVQEGDDLPRSMAALGDSITRGYAACGRFGDCPEASWSTGTRDEVRSHRRRLSSGTSVSAHNLAVSGATMAGLPEQADRAVDENPDYVTVLIGANDACARDENAMTPADAFRDHFAAAMSTLADGLPDARVLVASIPDLRQLWRVGREDSRAVATWERLGVCPSMLARPESTAPGDRRRRARVRERVVEYNAAMAAECGRHASCRWDGGAVFEDPFPLEAVSQLDFWHPSALGQRRLAGVSWSAGFWE